MDIWSSNQSLSLFLPSTDAIIVNVTDLAPFTSYDVWLTTEVKGSDGVLGAVLHSAEAFTTHAVAPDVVHVGCLPRGGTTTELLIGLRLQFPPNAFANVHESALRAVQYSLWYVADAATTSSVLYDAAGAIQNATNSTTRQAGQWHLSIPVHENNSVHIMAATDTTVDLHANVSGLTAGTNYSMAVVVETKGSHGLVGSVLSITGCGTHPFPPKLAAVLVAAQAQTTDTAVMQVSVEALTNVHYVLGTPAAFRQVPPPHSYTSLSTTYNASFVRFDTVSKVANVTSISLTDLNASTVYAVAVFAETVDSFGVYGPLSVPVTEFRTNDPAGNVTIVEAIPVLGTTTDISVKVHLTQPQNHVALCWKPAAPVAFTCLNHTGNIVVGNLTPYSTYELYVVASTLQRVESERSDLVTVSTHAPAPVIQGATLDRIDGRFDQLLATVATATSGWLHVGLFQTDALEGKPSFTIDGLVRRQWPAHHESVLHVSPGTTTVMLEHLAANTTYTLVVFGESASVPNGTQSNVYGDLHLVNVSTYALAPTILQSAALPQNATTDQLFLIANLSSPGRLHFMISDTDLHDPKVLKQPFQGQHTTPFVRRGIVDVTLQVWTTVNETRNGVNVTVDVALPIFNANHTIHGLAADTMYHVFLTTETFDSFGVFGALIAPHLATTHAPHPTFTSLSVVPTPGNPKSISLNLTLSRYGLVHYILLLRGLPFTSLEDNVTSSNGTEVLIPSEIESATLTGGQLQRASLAELGGGVLHNGSIPISRDEWAKVDTTTHKAFADLTSGATYELCVVAETDASNGVFGPVVCHVVTTFVDYSNATLLEDVMSAEPVPGRTDQVELTWRKLSMAKVVPYFVLAQGGHATFTTTSFGRTPFSQIRPGQHGVVAAGSLPKVEGTSDLYRIVVGDLDAHTAYSCYFSGETIDSFGVFTRVNNSFPVTTHAPPPVLSSYFARPASGNTTGVEVVLDVGCPKNVNCKDALVHVVVATTDCANALTAPFHLAHGCVLAYTVHNVSIPGNSIAKQHVVFLEDGALLVPNTTYTIHIATETPHSDGVFSTVKTTSVTTHPTPPTFVDLAVRPKHASTTELVLNYQLSAPGVVHFIIGEDSKHIDVQSVYNISAKKTTSGEDWHKYPPQTIAYRRSLTVPTTSPHTEVLGYLTANTSYTVWVVAETAADANLYTPLAVFANVSTFAPAPLLLSHAASPTPGSTTQLRLQYTTNDVTGVVHCLVAASTLWTPTLTGPTSFGNRIGYNTNIVAQVSLGNESNVVDISVPFEDTNYTIVLVTETKHSNGVFGAVAQLDNIKSSAPAPVVLDVHITATDARTDSLTVNVRLDRAGTVHYSLTEANHPLAVTEPPPFVVANSTNVSFVTSGLRESTWYDVYLQTETLDSGGVVGSLVKVVSPVPTHGPPPVVLEEVDCSGAPNCDTLGREPCWLVSNTCGECREGYFGDEPGPSNGLCVAGTKKKGNFNLDNGQHVTLVPGKKTIGIKVSGVKQPTPPAIAEVEVQSNTAAVDLCPANAHMSLETNRCECVEGYVMEHNACILQCPPNSSMSAPGRCQCDPGFVLDSLQTSCCVDMTEATPVAENKEGEEKEEAKPPPPPWFVKLDLRHFSMDRFLYTLDTFISTKKGQTSMLVGFGLFLMVFCGLFYSLLPHGVPAGKHATTTTVAAEDIANVTVTVVNDSDATNATTTAVPDVPSPTDAPEQYTSLIESIWACWLFIADPGAQGELHEWNKRVFAFFVSVIGMVYFFVIMGFVVDSIRDKMEDLKKGRSNVIEKNHSLLLGWSDKSVSLVKQLCLANESEGGGVVVVLAELEKERIEAELESQMEPHEYHGTKVVVRSGSPLITNDLKKVSAHTARSITIMATSIDADKSDASCLRVILSLRGLFKLQGHVVAEIRDIDNEPLVHLVGGSIVETLVSHDIIGRLILLSARSPGLSRVYNSVLGFDGDEFYNKAWPEVVGVPFGELIVRFPAATPIGVKTVKGKIVIKPSMTYKIEDGDEIIVLAEDNDTYKPEPPTLVPPVPIPVIPAKDKIKEKILVCGWRRDIQDMLVLLDSFLERGSEVHLLNELTV
ncbi:hypothetical protein DYB34_001117 [Aphanomyces astaci]|uniref:RCK N-terminal domain-containing protein n=1 Tax=Aphanomyces astaci TaxID=112090 RepID=A0A418B4V1_APHAT|nr:hypothetical protein DYB34_001117 [Aphanomyces astaci]